MEESKYSTDKRLAEVEIMPGRKEKLKTTRFLVGNGKRLLKGLV